MANQPFELRDPRTRRKILAVLNRTEGVSAVSNQVLLRLVLASELRHFEPGQAVWSQGQPADALFVLLDGAVAVTGDNGKYEMAAGQAVGVDAVLHNHNWASTGQAMTPVVALRVPKDALHTLATQSTALRRALRKSAQNLTHKVPDFVVQADEACVEHVMVAVPAGWSEQQWVRTLAAVWAAHLPTDAIAVLVADPDHKGPPVVQKGTPQTWTVAGDANEARLDAALDMAKLGYVLVDASRCTGATRSAWQAKATKVVAWQDGPAKPDLHGFSQLAAALVVARVPGVVGPLPHESVRINLNQADLGGAPSPAAVAGMERLCRALTDRTVGLALGGGGAWGYAHVALIREIRKRGVPIDLVAGCSFGAMVGSYYCSKGLDGLELLVKNGKLFSYCLPLAVATSRIIGGLVERDLGKLDLDDFEVPFLPVATDVSTGEAVPIAGTRVGFGVRASGSFPGIFAPTTASNAQSGKRVRYVDGGIRDNVPEAAILAAGCDLLVASNIVPPPAPDIPPAALFAADWWQPIHEFNPVQRLVDVWRSTFILFHAAGQAEALGADVVYDASPNRFLATEFAQATAIVEDAQAYASQVADKVQARWLAMQ